MGERDAFLLDRPLKAAVIGVGYLGRFHAQKYAQMDGVELVGVADLVPARARQVGKELGVSVFGDFSELLSLVDLVSVVTPSATHFSVAKACLLAGVHVLVEKPMTILLEEADVLVALAGQQQRILQVGHIKRFHPAVMRLERSGLLDRPRYIESQRWAPFKNRALDVDVVLDLMIHDVDLILHFVGSPVVDVDAMGTKVVTDHIDIASARLRFQNGCIAQVSASRMARESTRRMRIFQPNALIEIDFMQSFLRIVQRGSGEMVLDGIPVPAIEETRLPIERHDALEVEIQAFCQAVRGNTPPVVSGQDGRDALAVVTMIRQGIAAFLEHTV